MVRDNGLGVPEEAREQLFQRFFRAHDETVTSEEGTGLGLSIVRETMAAIGGRAWADWSERGETVFGLAFPCEEESPRDPPHAPTVDARDASAAEEIPSTTV